jgi:hypothetical protein
MKKYCPIFGILLVVLLAAGFVAVRRLNETRLTASIKEIYELSNPGSVVTEIELVRTGVFYKVLFKLDGLLMETNIDFRGRYIFPERVELETNRIALQSQRNFFACLAGNNTVLFGKSDTNATLVQLNALRNSPYAASIYFDCIGDKIQTCVSLNVTTVPAWGIGNQLVPSLLTIEQLTQLTGCQYAP